MLGLLVFAAACDRDPEPGREMEAYFATVETTVSPSAANDGEPFVVTATWPTFPTGTDVHLPRVLVTKLVGNEWKTVAELARGDGGFVGTVSWTALHQVAQLSFTGTHAEELQVEVWWTTADVRSYDLDVTLACTSGSATNGVCD